MTSAPDRRGQAMLALFLTMILWGTSAVFLRETALALSPPNALALRFLVLAALLGPALLLARDRRVDRDDWPRLAIVALPGMFGSGWFTAEGYGRIGAGLGTVVTMAEPITIALLAWLLLRERPRARIWLGLAVAGIGGAVLFWPDISGLSRGPADLRGILYIVAATLCFGLYTIVVKPLLARHSSLTIAAWTTLIAAAPVLVLAPRPLPELVSQTPAAVWAEIIYLALCNSVIGMILWNFGTRHLPGAVAGSFLYLLPVIGVAAGHLLLDEPVTPYLIAGGAIILAGVAMAQSRSG